MTEPTRTPAPAAVGDIIDGDPPVPITVWHVPAARTGETMSLALAERLVMNFTHAARLVIDMAEGGQLARATNAARRRHLRQTVAELAASQRQAALVVVGWPAVDVDATRLFADCADRLMAGGCVAVVLGAGPLTVNQLLIAAARGAGLTYLQHIIAAHDLTGRRGQRRTAGSHVPVHSDVLVFRRPPIGGGHA